MENLRRESSSGGVTNSVIKIKFLFLVNHAQACDEFAGSITALLHLRNTASLEEMLKRWQHCMI